MQRFREVGYRILNSAVGILFFVLCLLFFNMPDELVFTKIVQRIGTRGIYALAGCLFVLYLSFKKNIRQDGLLIVSAVFALFVTVLTYIRSGQTVTAFNNYVVCGIGALMLFSLFFDVNEKKYLWTAFVYYCIIVLIDNATGIAYSTGSSGITWFSHLPSSRMFIFCGNVNLNYIYTAIAFSLGMIVAEKYCRWVWPFNFALLGFSLYIAYRTDCLTGMIILSAMIPAAALALLANRFRFFEILSKGLNLYVTTAVNILLAVLAFLASIGKLSLFEGFDITFHSRAPIWKFAVKAFLENPVFGNGLQVPINTEVSYSHVHSLFIEIPYLSGIFGTALFVLIGVLIAYMLGKVQKKSVEYGLSFMLGLFFTASLMEFYPVQGMFTLFGAVYYGARTFAVRKRTERKKDS